MLKVRKVSHKKIQKLKKFNKNNRFHKNLNKVIFHSMNNHQDHQKKIKQVIYQYCI